MASVQSGCDWAKDLFLVLRTEGIRHIATVPDGGLTSLLQKCEAAPNMNVITLTSPAKKKASPSRAVPDVFEAMGVATY